MKRRYNWLAEVQKVGIKVWFANFKALVKQVADEYEDSRQAFAELREAEELYEFTMKKLWPPIRQKRTTQLRPGVVRRDLRPR